MAVVPEEKLPPPEVAAVPEPPEALISNNPLRWMRIFGPGAIVASVTIGSGELVFSSRGGAIFGFDILSLFVAVCILKWVLVYSSMRHMILSGAHPFDRWNRVGGPPGWFPMFMIVIFIVSVPIWYSFLAGILGTALVWIFGFGQYHWWATGAILLALAVLLLGTYSILEKIQLTLLTGMLACMLFAVFYLTPDWLEMLADLVPTQSLKFPDWLVTKYPADFATRSPLVEIVMATGAIGGASFDYLAYTSFLREKKWGHCHMGLVSRATLDATAADRQHRARTWLRAALIDNTASFVMLLILSACFVVLGRVILLPQELVPAGEDLLRHQGEFLLTISPLLLPLYKIAIIFAFFGSLYGGPEMNFRIIYEYLRSQPGIRKRVDVERLRMPIILYILLGGIGILLANRYVFPEQFNLIALITPAGIYTNFFTCGFYSLANPWVDWRFLPRELRMPKFLVVLNLIGAVFFLYLGMKATQEQVGPINYYLLFGLIFASILICWKIRRFTFPDDPNPAEPGISADVNP